MKKPSYCCDQTCQQGRHCLHRRAEPPTVREWVFCLILLVLGLLLSFIPFYHQQ